MTKTIAKTDLQELLAAADGDYVGAWNKLVESVGAELTATAKRSTIADRKERWLKGVVGKIDRGLVAKLNKLMTNYPKIIRSQTIDLAEPRILAQDEIDTLMAEALDRRDIIEALEARKNGYIRHAVDGHLDTEAAEAGDEFPEFASGRVVSTLGFDFAREAGDPVGTPVLNEEKLAEGLGELADEVFETRVVTTKVLDTEKLMKLAAANPELMLVISDALEPGKPRKPRHVIRATQPTTTEK